MKSLPQSETKAPGVECRTQNGVYVITSNAERTRFTLWRMDGEYTKIQTAESPTALYDLIYPPEAQKEKSSRKRK